MAANRSTNIFTDELPLIRTGGTSDEEDDAVSPKTAGTDGALIATSVVMPENTGRAAGAADTAHLRQEKVSRTVHSISFDEPSEV